MRSYLPQGLKTVKAVASAVDKVMVWSLALRVRSWTTAQSGNSDYRDYPRHGSRKSVLVSNIAT